MNVEVVIPHGQADPPGRVVVREHIVAHYRREHPDWRVILAECPTPQWSKGRAANPHLLTSTADVVVLADADSWIDPRMMAKAVTAVATGEAQWAAPFTLVKRICQDDTERILAGEQIPIPKLDRKSRGLPGGGIVVGSPAAWQAVNGVDPRFGWGGEDACLGMALRSLAGLPWTPDQPTVLWHLWHPAVRKPVDGANELWNRYRRTRRRRDELAAIVEEW